MPPSSHPPTTRPKRVRTTALIVSSALFMEHLDGTVLSTALPTMAKTFNVSPLHMSIALTSYLLSLAVFIPASGTIADRYGARRVFCAAIAVFTIGSILCGQAQSLPMLVVSRLLQGLGGAMMVPVGRLVLLRSVPKSELVSAMAWFLVPALIGPVAGPPVGGFLVSNLSWRWIFYVNVPIGLIGILLANHFIEDIREPSSGRFDWAGLFLSGISLACLMFSFELIARGAAEGLTPWLLLACGLVSGGLYLIHAGRHPSPILNMSLMKVPTFRLSVIGGSLTRITGGAMPFLLPMMMQLGFGMTAQQSGVVTFASAAGALLMKAVASPILKRLGFRGTLIWNAALSTAVIACCAAFRPWWPMPLIYGVLLFGGFFISLQFTAYNAIAYAEIDRPLMSAATSFYTTFQQMTLSLGIVISAGALQTSMVVFGHKTATMSDFTAAFLVITAISVCASPVCARFPRNAGMDMSGHKPQDEPEASPKAA